MTAHDPGTAVLPRLRVLIGLAGLQFGGCQINAVDLASELRRRGHEVTLFAVADEPLVSIVPLAREHGFEIEILPAEPDPVAQSRPLTALVDRTGAEVVHVFGSWLAEPAALALTRRPRTALVVLNWTMANTPGLPPCTPLLLGTEALRREAAHLLRAPVLLLEPPVDTTTDRRDPAAGRAFRKQWGISEEEGLLVLVSRLDRDMKAESVAQTIRALPRLAEPGASLLVVGHGDAAQELSALATQVNAEAGRTLVTLTGSLQDPGPAYSAADVVLAMGGAALRGLAFGRPTVVLGEGGFCRPFLPQTVEYFLENGFYGVGGTAPDPVDELARQLDELLAPESRPQLGAWGRQLVVDRYSLEVVASTLESVYADALRRTNPVRRWTDVAYLLTRARFREVRRRLVRRGPRRGPATQAEGGLRRAGTRAAAVSSTRRAA